MPLVPEKDLYILNNHAEIFPEYIDLLYRFNKSELIRWKFPNRWGVSLVTTDYKYINSSSEYCLSTNEIKSHSESRMGDWEKRYENGPRPKHTELVSLSYHKNTNGEVYPNYIIPRPIDDITVSELVIILSRVTGIKLSFSVAKNKYYDLMW